MKLLHELEEEPWIDEVFHYHSKLVKQISSPKEPTEALMETVGKKMEEHDDAMADGAAHKQLVRELGERFPKTWQKKKG